MQDKRKDIVDAAVRTVAEQGLQRTTTAAIAAAAGVGEGTLYRYFKNKDELFECGANRAWEIISDGLLENYDPLYPVYTQYVRLCQDFLTEGLANPVPHQFIEQFRNSPLGVEYKRKRLAELEEDSTVKPVLFPLNAILNEARKQEIVKDYPLQVLASLTVGPLVFVLKDGVQGLLKLDNSIINGVAKACWDSIKR